MKIKNKLLIILSFVCILNIILCTNVKSVENIENEVLNNENIQADNEVANNVETQIENEKDNKAEEKQNKDNNVNEQEKENEVDSKIEKEEQIDKNQEEKNEQKEFIKSNSISFNCKHTGELKSNQYIMKKANEKSKKIIVVKKSKKVTILGEKSDFYKVEYKKGKKKYKGYIKKKYIILKTNYSIVEGYTKKLTLIIKPTNSTDKVNYKSSNKKIAKVNSQGVVTAKKNGQVKITATTESGKTDYVMIEIKKYKKFNKKAHTVANLYENVNKIVYGKSVLGQNLEAYEIKGNGKNSKVMFIEAAVHGFEDEYPRDAKVIVNLANDLVEYYAKNSSKLKDYTFIIIPCVNPDGTFFGKNNYRADKKNAFGRCTYKGIDINRDFDKKRFKAKESKALKKLMKKYSDRIKVNIDLHGWEDSVLGDKKIVKAFRKYVRNQKDKSGLYGGKNAFVISYTNKILKAHSALVEFKNSKSVKAKKVEKAINTLVDIY